MKRRVYNAITGEWLDKTANKVNNNERRKVYNAITGEWLEDSFAQNTPKISNNTQQIDEQYLDTGKTYGDYWYQEYSTRKDDKIYSKGGKYYVFNSKTGDYQDVDKISYMTNADVDAKQLEEAQKNGYKGNKADLIKISNKILLDTGDLTKKEYAEYAKDLKRQEEKLNNEQKEKTKIRYSGTGIDAVKQIGSNVSDLSYSANKEIINPIVNFNDNYNIGKQNNELALEYYKKMEGKKNNAEQLEQKINKFNRYNKDLITNPGAAGSAIQNLNTQVESFKKQGIATIAGGTIGGIIGGTSGALAGGVGAIPGAISGAKTGATIGYTFGGVPYTYKLEAGNQYKELVSAGIPEKIAKDVSRKTGAINAAIESGENIVDIITLGQAGKLTGAAQQELYDQLEKAYGKKALKTLLIKTGYSYGQNILSESMEEMSQEGTSIHYEKEAFKKAGIDRNVTAEEDIDRVLEAGKSAAISTAFTAPITSLSGSIVTNVVNNLQIKANDRINTISKTEINDEIKKQVINYNNQNSTNLSADEILSIQKQVNNNLEQNNVTIVDNKIEKTLPTVYDIVAQEKNSVTASNENIPIRRYQYVETGNTKIDNLRKSASQYFNDSNTTKDMLNVIEKVIDDKNYNVVFDNTITNKNGKEVNAQITTNSKNEVEIRLNPNSPQVAEFLIVHEVTHAVETDSMKKLIIDYASKHNDFAQAVESLKQTYGTNDVSSEVIADISGQLFGNQEFINNLSMEQPSIFKRIYNAIVSLANKITGNSRESLFIKDLKNKWETAYRNTTTEQAVSNLNNETFYSKQVLKDGTPYVQTETGLFTKDDGTSMTQREMYNSLVGKTITFDDGITAKIVNRLPSKDMYNELFKRLPRYQDVKNVKSVNTNINENVIELLENSKNISPNEPDYMSRHQKQGISSFDTRKVSFYDGKNAYDLDFSIAKLKDGSYVAYAKRNLVSNKILLNKIKKEMPRSKSSLTSLSYSNTLPQKSDKVKLPTKYSMQENINNTQELDNSSFSLKQKQLEIIQNNNPVQDDYHTWIRNINDIKTLEETLNDGDWSDYDEFNPDLTRNDIQNAINKGKITVYSSYPIEQGIFVSPSKMEAESYSGNGKIYSKEVNINDIAWIDPTQGQYAKVQTFNEDIRHSQENKIWQEYLDKHYKPTGTRTNMQNNNNNNTNKINFLKNQNIDSNMISLEKTAPLIEEKNTLGYIPQDPTRESTYDDPITQPITEFQRALDREMEYGIKSTKEINNKNNLRHQVSETYGWLQEQFVNRNYEIDKYAKQTNNNEIMFKGDMLNSVAGEVSGEINVAQTDNYGHKIGESLSSLFKKSKEKGYYEQFDDYLKHYSNIDRHKFGKGSVVPLEYSQKMIAEYDKAYPQLRGEATHIWNYGRNILDNLEENGLISKEYKNTLEEMYPHYVPYMQSENMVPYMDDSGEIKPKKVIKRAEGNAHDLVTIEESFARYTYAAKKAIRQNDLYKEIVKSTKEKVSFGADDRVDPTQLDNSLMRDSEGNNYLTAYVDGLQQQVKINDNLYNELLRTDEKRIKAVEEKLSLVIKPLQKLSEIRRNILTTWNPSFISTNPIKDVQDGLFNSKYTKDFSMYLPTSIYELATQSTETARQFSSLYGSGMVMGDYQVDKLNNAVKNMDIKQVNKLLKIIPNANELVELAPRYAEFKASLKNGTSVTEAMYNAREVTTNFNRGGYITKALNRDGFTFLNASVQGFDKLIRNLTGINGTKGFIGGVTGIMTKVAVLGIAPALFNAMSFGAGDDEEDEDYKALPNYIKDNYYLFKVKGLGNKSNKYYDGTFIRIPKGRMLSVFGSAARRTLEYAKGDKNAFDGYLENVQSQIGINNPEENNIFAPIKQAFGSKNGEAWYGGDLVPKRLQNKPVAEQYDESTDEFSKWLGEMLNISPYKINYLLDQYSGGAGDIILPMITSETTNGATKVSDYLLAPIKDKFIVNSTDDNKYASNFYSLLEKTQIQANSDKATDSDKLKYKYMTSINSELSKLYKEKREIQMNDTLSKKEKYKKVQNIQKEINELSKEGTKIPKVKDLKSNYAKLNNDEYYKNQKGTWTKIKEEETNQLKELNMSANEKNEYFIAKNKIGVIRNNEDLENDVKKNQISNIIIDLNMSDDKLSYLYSKYYSSEETLEVIKSAGISIKEFIKYNSQDFTTDYYSNGKEIPNSRKNKVIKYVNSLNLSIPQKALLIKMEYSSYKKYDKQIAEYVNSMNISFLDKASILKKAGFTSYDKQIINYVNKMNITKTEKEEILEEMGFTIRNGRVYSK